MPDNKKVHLKRYKKKPPGISYWDFLTNEEIVEEEQRVRRNKRI